MNKVCRSVILLLVLWVTAASAQKFPLSRAPHFPLTLTITLALMPCPGARLLRPRASRIPRSRFLLCTHWRLRISVGVEPAHDSWDGR